MQVISRQLDVWTERLLFGVALVVCILPVLVVKGLSQPFLTPRELLLRLLAISAAPLLVLYWGRRVTFRLGVTGWAVVAVLGAGLLSTLFSHNPTVSFWGNADRLTGFVTLVELVVLGVALYTVFLHPARRKIVLLVWSASWGVVAVWAILERIIPGFWAQFNGGGGRSAGTFGNPIFLANSLLAATVVVFPVALSIRHVRTRWLACSLAIVLGGWSILNTETRGAYVGVLMGGLLTLGAMGMWSRRRAVRVLGLGIPVLLCLAVLGLYVLRNHPTITVFSSGHSYFSRALSVFNRRDPSQLQRFSLWRTAISAVQERPFAGWGLEQFDTALDRLYDPHFTIYDVSNSYSDRAHNTFLDVAVAGGLMGLAAYLFLFAAVIWRVVQAKRAGVLGTTGGAAALGGVIAYLGMLLTAFETFGTLFGLSVGIAVLCAVTRQEQQQGQKGLPQRSLLLVAILLSFGGVWLIARTVVPVARASQAVHLAITTQSGEVLLGAAKQVQDIAQPYRPQYEVRVANEIFKAVGTGKTDGRAAPREALLRQAEALLRDARVGLPNHFGTQLMLGNVLLLEAAYGLADVNTAIAEIQVAQALGPQRQVTYFQIGNAYLVVGDTDRAHEEFETALALDPSVSESQWHAARGRAAVGDVAGAASLFTQAWRGGFGDNRPDPELVLAINTMITAGDLRTVQDMYGEWVTRPDAPAARWASLAVVAAENGDTQTAIQALRRALVLDPTLAEEASAFLEQYGLPPDALSASPTDP